MKRILYLLIPAFLAFTACEPIIEPHADFDVSKNFAVTYENIEFFNNSTQATDFEWDFGDGYLSYDENPIHAFKYSGVYTVKLSAFYHNRVDYSYITIEVVDPSILTIKVLEFYNHYVVANASIVIYPTLDDWIDETNMITEVYTNAYGVATVEGLEPGYYYLDILETNHNNYSLAAEDVNFIKTPWVDYGVNTVFTAYVDYVANKASKSTPFKRRDSKVLLNKNRVFTEVIQSK